MTSRFLKSHATAALCALLGPVAFAQTPTDHPVTYNFAGYTDFTVSNEDGEGNAFASARVSPIVQALVSQRLFLEAEGEFEYTQPDGQSVESDAMLEYAAAYYIINDNMELGAGKFLSPVGQFIQNLHPTWVNKLPTMPVGFAGGHHGSGAAPTSEIGFQLRGGVATGKESRLNYAIFTGNGPNMTVEEGENETYSIGGINGVARLDDPNDNKSVGARIGFLPTRVFEFGVSYENAVAGVSPVIAHHHHDDEMSMPEEEPVDIASLAINDRNVNVLGFDFYSAPRSMPKLRFRGEFVNTKLSAGAPNELDPESKTWRSWYAQAEYAMTQKKMESIVRYGEFTPATEPTQRQLALGLDYLISTRTRLKGSFEFNDAVFMGTNRLVLQFAHGF